MGKNQGQNDKMKVINLKFDDKEELDEAKRIGKYITKPRRMEEFWRNQQHEIRRKRYSVKEN